MTYRFKIKTMSKTLALQAIVTSKKRARSMIFESLITRSLKALMDKASFTNEELRDVLKKVLAIMTLGVDLSTIFTEVLMFSYTSDVISKKMIYLYLTTYAETNEETAIMALNTFLKDCNHQDGKMRGLALRTLCSLKIPSALDYIQQQVLLLLEDRDSYVRKTAIVGVLRIYYLNNTFFEEHELMNKLYNFLKDPNRSVVMGAIFALEEIMLEEGGMVINSKIILYLMNRFNDFDNYGKNIIVSLLHKYQPKHEEEMFNIMNLLEDNLRKSSIPLALSAISLFLQFTLDNKIIFDQVLERITPNLISMACIADDEQLFVVLTHILTIVKSSAKKNFENDYKLFYCKAYDRNYNSKLKINILVELATKENINDIVEEFSEYAGEGNNPEFAKDAIRGISELLHKFPDKSVVVLKRLLIFVKLGKTDLVFTILDSIKDIVCVLPDLPEELMGLLETAVTDGADDNSLISLMSIIAQVPIKIKAAPYIAENILNIVMEQKHVYGREVLINMISCLVRIFVKRPGETLPILSQYFQFLFETENNYVDDVDLVERVMFYYNMLKNDLSGLIEICEDKYVKTEPVDADENLVKDLESYGLNDLRLVYKKPTETFIKPLEFFTKVLINKKPKPVVEEDHEQEDAQIDEEDHQEEKKSDNDLMDLDVDLVVK